MTGRMTGKKTLKSSVVARDAPATPPPAHVAPVAPSPPPADDEISRLLHSVPEDQRTLVKVIVKLVSLELHSELHQLKDNLKAKDSLIEKLNDEVSGLKDRVSGLEAQIDDVDQYERRDTVIISGPALPPETTMENCANVAITTFKEQLKVNIRPEDISVAHRLGKKAPQRSTRPIIVKLVNRSIKQDLVNARIQLRPNIYINESLTPKRTALLKKILNVRRIHKQKFQQCYTHDGKIIVKLRNSTIKHTITDERSLASFLDKYPDMERTYIEQCNQPGPSDSR